MKPDPFVWPAKRGAVCLMSVALCLCIAGSCSHMRLRTIEFIVPVGFKGPFVTVTREDGQVCVARGGKITLVVPPSGVVAVQDGRIFNGEFRLVARYADGTPLEVEGEASNTVALRVGGDSAQLGVMPHMRWFVGSEEDFARSDFSELLKQIPRPLPTN